MTIKEAEKLLSGKLIFGNEEQIKAVTFLEKVAEAKRKIMACEFGVRHVATRYENNEHAAISIEMCDGMCGDGFKDDVIVAALRGLKDAAGK